MADRLGIVTQYQQSEVTQAAIHLAEYAKARGTRTTIYGAPQATRNVAKAWDAKVVTAKQSQLAEWAGHCNKIIYTNVPSQRELLAVQALGVETALLVDWERLLPEHRGVVLSFDKVLFPYRCVASAVARKWCLSRVRPILLPWDVPVPFTRARERVEPRQVWAYFPMYDTQPKRLDQAVFKLMYRILVEVPHANIRVACGQSWSLLSRRILKALRKDFGDRVDVVSHPNLMQRLLLFARSDLTVWMPRFESFALIGLTSLCMGTPVISWDMRPQNEFLRAWKNAVLVPVRTAENWLGVPEIQGGYGDFSELLIATLRDKPLLAKMRAQALSGLESRRKQFEVGWNKFHC